MTAVLIDWLLAFALVVVVPLTLRLEYVRRAGGVVIVGVVSASSFLLPRGMAAAALTLPWVIVATYVTIFSIRANRVRSFDGVLRVLPAIYLVIGAGWLAISRYGARPLRFSDEIVELTAMHFHYAGFVTPFLVFQLWQWLADHEPGRAQWGRHLSAAVVTATPITAAGITFAPALGAVGATLFAIALTTTSVIVLTRTVPSVGGLAALLLSISSLTVIATMILAVAYSLGQWLGTPAPSVPVMVWTHGLGNAVAFAFTGVLGWTVLRITLADTPERVG